MTARLWVVVFFATLKSLPFYFFFFYTDYFSIMVFSGTIVRVLLSKIAVIFSSYPAVKIHLMLAVLKERELRAVRSIPVSLCASLNLCSEDKKIYSSGSNLIASYQLPNQSEPSPLFHVIRFTGGVSLSVSLSSLSTPVLLPISHCLSFFVLSTSMHVLFLTWALVGRLHSC